MFGGGGGWMGAIDLEGTMPDKYYPKSDHMGQQKNGNVTHGHFFSAVGKGDTLARSMYV